MKQVFFSILFTSLYLIAMVRPMLPVIDYVVNYKYITTELCENKDKPEMHCNGKCYLKKELKKANNLSGNHSPETTLPPNLLKDYPISTLDFFSFSALSNLDLNRSKTLIFRAITYSYLHVWDIFHPPIG